MDALVGFLTGLRLTAGNGPCGRGRIDGTWPGRPARHRSGACWPVGSRVLAGADEFVFGEVWGRPGLDFEGRMLVAISSLATQGEGALLRNYAHGALQAGVSARKIHEALVELVVYAGFPTATSMLFEWQQVLAAARRQGVAIRDDVGEVADIYDNS